MSEPSVFGTLWPYLLGGLSAALALAATAHIVLTKKDERAAVAWIMVAWLSPLAGVLLYYLFGINRIKRRALRLRGSRWTAEPSRGRHRGHDLLVHALGEDEHTLKYQANLIERFGQPPFTVGNRAMPLQNGEEAYPAMLEAIRAARRSVALETYIFNRDPAGERFVEALAQAAERGVEVRVLVDGLGSLYSLPPATRELRRRGVPAARFLYSLLPWRMPYLNLRNHRKILVVDGRIGFTGGMNIKHGHLLQAAPRWPTADLHFRLDGPVVGQLMDVFADDWTFTTGEKLSGEAWFPALEPKGPVILRGLASGPDEAPDTTRLTVMGALADARRTIRIVTPYFLPDREVGTLLALAALRGIAVDIVVPERSNQFFVKWAETPYLDEIFAAGCRVWLQPPPFDHTKLALADGRWALFGSSNWDARSFALNFEFNVECFDEGLARALGKIADAKIARARRLSREELRARSLAVRLRDGVARLFRPYL